ncbi:hypothetical protein BDB00DRAFT_846296, partial [Zychaea mexicana]|uniref:uncharacterized protein n=1 Tax=Zychaea mexicana TaxID=64656 RepID=UPI0022FE6786
FFSLSTNMYHSHAHRCYNEQKSHITRFFVSIYLSSFSLTSIVHITQQHHNESRIPTATFVSVLFLYHIHTIYFCVIYPDGHALLASPRLSLSNIYFSVKTAPFSLSSFF